MCSHLQLSFNKQIEPRRKQKKVRSHFGEKIINQEDINKIKIKINWSWRDTQKLRVLAVLL